MQNYKPIAYHDYLVFLGKVFITMIISCLFVFVPLVNFIAIPAFILSAFMFIVMMLGLPTIYLMSETSLNPEKISQEKVKKS